MFVGPLFSRTVRTLLNPALFGATLNISLLYRNHGRTQRGYKGIYTPPPPKKIAMHCT